MPRPDVAGLVLALALTALPGHRLLAQEPERKRPNILFIMADDHGSQALGCYGSRVNQTPNLDRIARGGMRFDRCFVTNAICGPSRATILTGKYSHLNGFRTNSDRFDGSQQTVAKLLQAAGYQTAMIGKWHLVSDPTGFDHWEVLRGQGPYYNPVMLTADGPVRHVGYTTDIITDLALDWINNTRDPDRPFLLMCHHKAPHRNWQPAARYLMRYDDAQIPEPDTLFDDYSGRGTAAHTQEMTVARHLLPHDLKLVRQRELNDEQRKVWDAAYDPKNEAFNAAKLEGADLVRWKYQRYAKDYLRCVDAVDEGVGRLLDHLDEAGLAENTIVIYTSDQGWYLGEHGWFDKRWMYEESFRTPLLVRWPGHVTPGSATTALAMNLDFAETFLDAAGVPVPDDMQGRSLLPVLEGHTPEDWRDSVYYHYYEFPGAHMVRRHLGVRTARHKLIHFYRLGEWELYDLQRDPDELHNVHDDPAYADVAARLKVELTRLRRQYGDEDDDGARLAAQARAVEVQEVLRFDSIEARGDGTAVELPASEAPDCSVKPLTLSCRITPAGASGVVLAQGGESYGYCLYLQDGALVFAVRNEGILRTTQGPRLPVGEEHLVRAVLDADGRAWLSVDGERLPRARELGLITHRPAEGLGVAGDPGTAVAEYEPPFPFTGTLRDLVVSCGSPGW